MDYKWMVLSFVLAPNFIREPESVRGLKRVGVKTPGIQKVD